MEILVTGPNYLLLLLSCFDVGSGSSVDHASGGVGFIYYYGETVLGQLLPNNTSMDK